MDHDFHGYNSSKRWSVRSRMQIGNVGMVAYFMEESPKAAFPLPPSMLLFRDYTHIQWESFASLMTQKRLLRWLSQ